MPDNAAFLAYTSLAETVLGGQIQPGELPAAVSRFPLLTESLLEQLAQAAESAALTTPRRAWALMLAADCAAQQGDTLLKAHAAWHLGRAYNDWGQPRKAVETITRARQGFEELGETGWLAACDWQVNHLAWTRPNFAVATHQLETALGGLEQAGLGEFAIQCRLALSYGQILCGDFPAAQQNLDTCIEIFTARQDSLNLARCWLNEASSLRRQGNFEGALAKLEQTLSAFEQCAAPLDAAKTRYQLGLWYFLSGRDYPRAVEHFEGASAVFSAQGLDLWSAVCQNGLAQINIHLGSLSRALRELEQARSAFSAHGVSSLLADNHNDSGQLELLAGDLSKSLEHFRRAGELYHSLGFEVAAANALANHGVASARLGYYQDALAELEQAQKRFQDLNDPFRMASCALFLSRTWSNLNQAGLSHECLDQADALYRQINQRPMLAQVDNQRALVFALENRFAEAATALESALEISRETGLPGQVALAERQLGEMLLRSGDTKQALTLLTSAEACFRQMGMTIEQAVSLAALGDFYAQTSAPNEAEKAFLDALALSQGAMPEIESRCHAGLASLDEARGHLPAALDGYRAAAQAVARLRQGFWQPALAGSYLRTLKTTIDKSIQLAARLGAASDALGFIENGKAQTLTRQLSSTPEFAPGLPAEIQDLWLEIQGLQAQIRAVYNPSPWSRANRDLKPLQDKLIEAVQAYDRQLAALERASTRPVPGSGPGFDLSRFRAEASARLGNSWLALDYYLVGKNIVISLVGPDVLEIFETGIPARAQMALEMCVKSQRGGNEISIGDLKALGQVLLPATIQPYIQDSDTRLVISPHRELHNLPWAALLPGWDSRHLVETCLPQVVPSLQFLNLLWQRSGPGQTLARGLLLGLSNFQGKRPALPATIPEIRAIADKAHHESLSWLEADATWEHLLGLGGSLSAFGFLHLASHISHDPRTGRLSSITLYDQDVPLDRLRDIAPLPGLVTLSACNGAQSLVYEGDEHVGLAITCLLSGADTVIGSLWPVLDSAAAENLPRFYESIFTGHFPAYALAQAQRAAIQNGQALGHWAGLVCQGA